MMVLCVWMVLVMVVTTPPSAAQNDDDIIDECTALIGSLTAPCQDYWFGFPTNILTSFYSSHLAAYLCDTKCSTQVLTVAKIYVQKGLDE